MVNKKSETPGSRWTNRSATQLQKRGRGGEGKVSQKRGGVVIWTNGHSNPKSPLLVDAPSPVRKHLNILGSVAKFPSWVLVTEPILFLAMKRKIESMDINKSEVNARADCSRLYWAPDAWRYLFILSCIKVITVPMPILDLG